MIGSKKMKDAIKKIHSDSGYALLFSVLLVAILLSITIGIANVAFKELNFTNTAKDSHVAFYAADTGGECALQKITDDPAAFNGADPTELACTLTHREQVSPVIGSPNRYTYTGFEVPGGGCVIVKVEVDSVAGTTTVNSYGYNVNCDLADDPVPNARRVERLITYIFTAPPDGNTGGGQGGNQGGGQGGNGGTSGT
jgi:hypothetical protein